MEIKREIQNGLILKLNGINYKDDEVKLPEFVLLV